MENYQTIKVNGRTHVVCDIDGRGGSGYPYPNYMGTGKALCGVVDKGDTFDDWKRKRNERWMAHLRLNIGTKE